MNNEKLVVSEEIFRGLGMGYILPEEIPELIEIQLNASSNMTTSMSIYFDGHFIDCYKIAAVKG